MRFVCVFSLLLSFMLTPSMASAECVILLHGLGRTDASMHRMERRLSEAGFEVLNVSYPSTRLPIEELASMAIEPALELCADTKPISFVTHSMGGILVRQYLKENTIDQLKSVVMLGPPNRGSEVVDTLGRWKLFKWINGSAGLQLGTGADDLPVSLGAVDYNVGIIAGSRSINLLLSLLIPGKDDGKVSIENTKLEGMKDHVVLPVTHPVMMRNRSVIEQVIYFLGRGSFSHTIDRSNEK